jgi:hypothetical protein
MGFSTRGVKRVFEDLLAMTPRKIAEAVWSVGAPWLQDLRAGEKTGHPYRGNQFGNQKTLGTGGTPLTEVVQGVGELTSPKGIGAVTARVWRVGDANQKEVYCAESKESASAYGGLHGDAQPKEYVVNATNVLAARNHFQLYSYLHPGKTMQDAVYSEDKKSGFKSSKDAWRVVQGRMMTTVRGKGFDAVLFTKPPAPAVHEMVVLNPKTLGVAAEGLEAGEKTGHPYRGNQFGLKRASEGSGPISGGFAPGAVREFHTGYRVENSAFEQPEGPTVTLYHETRVTNVESILQTGLQQKYAAVWNPGVWTMKSDMSQRASTPAPGPGSSVIQVVVPKKWAKTTAQGTVVGAEDVPPKYIKSVSVFPGQKVVTKVPVPGVPQVVNKFKGTDPANPRGPSKEYTEVGTKYRVTHGIDPIPATLQKFLKVGPGKGTQTVSEGYEFKTGG